MTNAASGGFWSVTTVVALLGALAGGCGGGDAQGSDAGGAQTPLSAAEREGLAYTREEEKLARDTYMALGALDPVFANIGASEQTHMDAVGALLARYGVDDPAAGRAAGQFASSELQGLHDALVAKGSAGQADALAVGAEIEELDIADIEALKATSTHGDLDSTYDRLTRGSRNHLRSFYSRLVALGIDYQPRHLGVAEFQAIVTTPTETGP